MKFGLNKRKIYEDLKVRAFFAVVCLFVLSFIIRTDQAVSSNSFPLAGDREPARKIFVIATAYSSDVGQTDSTPCIPADGYDLCEHYEKYGEGNTIAANFLPLGAQIKLPGEYGGKVFVVHDRMNSRYGNGRIDIWMPTREEAVAFGVKYLELELYGGSRWRIAYNN